MSYTQLSTVRHANVCATIDTWYTRTSIQIIFIVDDRCVVVFLTNNTCTHIAQNKKWNAQHWLDIAMVLVPDTDNIIHYLIVCLLRAAHRLLARRLRLRARRGHGNNFITHTHAYANAAHFHDVTRWRHRAAYWLCAHMLLTP